MRKFVINTFVTLDGVMQAPGGPEEDPTGNFKFGGWVFHYWDDMMGKTLDEFMVKPFELLLGRELMKYSLLIGPIKKMIHWLTNSMLQKNMLHRYNH